MPQKVVQLPSHYSDEDKAMYDDLINRGDSVVGKKLSENERFLLDIAARVTINQLKGYTDKCFDDEEIQEMKRVHKEAADAGVINTPSDIFYEDVIMLSDGSTFKHPLSYPEEYYNEININPEKKEEELVNVDIKEVE